MADDFDPRDVTWVLGEGDLLALCEAFEHCDEIVYDLETTGLEEHAVRGGALNAGYPARVALAQFTLPTDSDLSDARPTTWLLPLSHPDSPWLGQWRRVLRRVALAMQESGRGITGAHIKFDARWTRAQVVVDLSRQIVWDTQVSSHLLDETRSTKLKVRAPETFDVPPWDDFDLSRPGAAEHVPLFDLGMYGARDTYWTWRLAQAHRERMFVNRQDFAQPEEPEEIEDARLGKLAVWCAMPTVATLAAIEQRGLLLDREWVHKELAEHEQSAAEMQAQLAVRYPDGGLDPADVSFAPTSSWFRSWTALAVEAGELVVAELTPTGKARWSKGVLIRQARAGSKVAADLLAWRGYSKRAEFLRAWLDCATPQGVVHTTYNSNTVVTGRLSSSGPNLQQVTAALKPAFIPRPGHVFVDLDYSQIELRVGAFMSRCVPMIEAFHRGDDLHKILAATITGKELDAILPTERQAGKSANFGLLFGMGAYGFQMYAEEVYGVSFTIQEAVHVHRAFFETWKGIAEWHAKQAHTAHRTGQVVSPIGRVRRLPEIYDANPKMVAFAERSAINSPVQGFASDIMQIAAASIEGTLPGVERLERVSLVGTVHDSILSEVPEDNWMESAMAMRDRALSVPVVLRKLGCDFDVPLAVSIKVGTRWGLADVGVLE